MATTTPPSPLPSPSPTGASPPSVPFGALPLSSVPPPAFPKHKKPRTGPDLEQWTSYQPRSRQYFTLYDGDQEPITVDMVIKIDKVDQREHYSAADEAYILYRQNQFQLEVFMFGHLGSYSSNYPTEAPSSGSSPSYIEVNGSLVAIESLFYHVYALKQQKGEQVETSTEAESMVDLVQLGGPRNRKDFQPPSLCPIVHGRASYTRLQFRTATPNNARSHPDQPSPKQQYYRIVLSLVAQTNNALYFIFSKISPCFIVRGQNPGKFSQGRSEGSSSPPPLPLSPPHAGKASDNPPSPPMLIRGSSPPSPSRSRSSSPIRSPSPSPYPKSSAKMITKTKSSTSLTPQKPPTPIPAPKPMSHPNPPIGRNYSPPRSSVSPSPHSSAQQPRTTSSPSPSSAGSASSSPSPNPMPTHLLHQYSKILPHYAPPLPSASHPSHSPHPPHPAHPSHPSHPSSSYFTPIHAPSSPTRTTSPAPMRGIKRSSTNPGEVEWVPSLQGSRGGYHPDDYPPPPPSQYRKRPTPEAYAAEEEYHAAQYYRHHDYPPPPPSHGKRPAMPGPPSDWQPPPSDQYNRHAGVAVRPQPSDRYDDDYLPMHGPSSRAGPGGFAPYGGPPAQPSQYGSRGPPQPRGPPPAGAYAGYPEDYPHAPHSPPSHYGRTLPHPHALAHPQMGVDSDGWSQFGRVPHSDDWHTQLGRRVDFPPGYHPSQYGRMQHPDLGPEPPGPPGSKKLPFSSIR